MKISKVKHTRVAVGKQNTQSMVSGLLYKTPNGIVYPSIENHIREVVRGAQRMYQPFNGNAVYQSKKKSDKDELCFLAEKDITILAKEIVGKITGKNPKKSVDIHDLSSMLQQIYPSKNPNQTFEEFSKSFVSYITQKRLRKSLRRTFHDGDKEYDIADILIRKICDKITGNKKTVTTEEDAAFKKVVSLDFEKKEQIRQVTKSIQNGTVRVQVQNIGGVPKLVLPSSLNQSARDKKYLFDFVKDFANGQEEQDLLIKQAKAVFVLYACGVEKGSVYYDNLFIGGGSAWNWKGMLPEDADNFSEEAYRLCVERNEYLDKGEKRNADLCKEKIKKVLQKKLADNYRSAKDFLEKDSHLKEEQFHYAMLWLKYCQKKVENILVKKTPSLMKLGCAFLCRRVFREWSSYIAMKYVDLGKGVYHFATPQNPYDLSQKTVFGEIREEFRSGITSFDYERIKAEESLKRNMAISATYAATTFANSVSSAESRTALSESGDKKDDKSDILMYKKEELDSVLYKDSMRRMLQFFGGISKWGELTELVEPLKLAQCFQSAIKSIRNYSYHYGPKINPHVEGMDVLKELFEKEYDGLKNIFVSKYYSNNVPMFYQKKDIISLVNLLYSKENECPAQIPSFANILPRKEAAKYIRTLCNLENLSDDADVMEKFRSTAYFLLKEIYYNGFLQESNLKKRFLEAMNVNRNNENERAFKDFKGRINTLKELTFGEICQQIMTDVNLQNQGIQKIRTTDQKNNALHKDIYQHYKMLLMKFIRDAFCAYVGGKGHRGEYSFLKKPRLFYSDASTRPSVEDFVQGDWKIEKYRSVKEAFKEQPLLASWYVTAHFMPPKQLNHLKGDIKSYLQYVSNVNQRAKETKHRTQNIDTVFYNSLVRMLDFVAVFNGRISHEITDYFSSRLEYSKYLENFFAFDIEHYSEEELFFDGRNPILRRGVIFSVMYGMENILSKLDYSVTENEYKEYPKLKEKTAKALAAGKCENIASQRDVLQYQQLKNRLTLHDLLDYAEMIMDHLSQMVSFSYLRERDLLYYQLGMHYVRLYHGDTVAADSCWRKLSLPKVQIEDGAILYDIMSIYTPDLPLYGYDKDKQLVNLGNNLSTGTKMRKFLSAYRKQDAMQTYLCGLKLFVKEPEKDGGSFDIANDFRNSIDHMKYLSGDGMSLMDYYSKVFHLFFTYDTKLRKSISFIFNNIMMRYFLAVSLKFHPGADTCDIELKELKSDKFTYKFVEKDSIGNSKNKQYFEEVHNKTYITLAEKLMNLRL